MDDKLHVGIAQITKAINETFSKLGKKLKSEDAVWRALKANNLRHMKIDGKYAMSQSQINEIADPDCELFGLKGFADHIGMNEDQVKYLIRTGRLKWIDRILGTYACNVDSADNYRKE